MNKNIFLNQYRQFIDVIFNDQELRFNDDIEIMAEKRKLEDFLDFFNPWYIDKDGITVGEIEKVIIDKSIKALSVRDSSNYPTLWDRPEVKKPELLRPVIIATDKVINKTVIFDSNKTICRLIFRYGSPKKNIIDVIEIIGPDLQNLNPDFQALHQRF